MEEHIEVNVNEATLEELLQAVLRNTEATYSMANGKLEIGK